MKRRNNRFLAGTLAGLMMLTMLPVTALAAENGAADETTTLTATDGDAASDTSNNIVNVVSDGENGQQAVNNVNIAANSGTENVQESADNSEKAQESTDDSSGGSADTAAPAPQEGEAAARKAAAPLRRAKTVTLAAAASRLLSRKQRSQLRLVIRSMTASSKRLPQLKMAIRLKSVRILPLKKADFPSIILKI